MSKSPRASHSAARNFSLSFTNEVIRAFKMKTQTK